MDHDRQPYTMQQKKSIKKCLASMENRKFDRQTALFNAASMEAIT
jgi:hypothetical protein